MPVLLFLYDDAMRLTAAIAAALVIAGCRAAAPEPCPPQSAAFSVAGIEPQRAAPVPPLEAIELPLPDGRSVQITSKGEVFEDGRAVRISRRRRERIRETFRQEPRDAVGFLAFVPPQLREGQVRARRGGEWSFLLTYRLCDGAARTSDNCRWVTQQTNGFIDRVARLAGVSSWRPRFPCSGDRSGDDEARNRPLSRGH